MCPEQQAKGICKLTRCPYPHQTRTVKIEQSHIEKPECVRNKRRKQASKCPSTGDIMQRKVKSIAAAAHEIEQDAKLNMKRYFDDGNDDVIAAVADTTDTTNSKNTCDQANSVGSTSESSSKSISLTNDVDCEKIIVVRKPIVGSLPSFIPIG